MQCRQEKLNPDGTCFVRVFGRITPDEMERIRRGRPIEGEWVEKHLLDEVERSISEEKIKMPPFLSTLELLSVNPRCRVLALEFIAIGKKILELFSEARSSGLEALDSNGMWVAEQGEIYNRFKKEFRCMTAAIRLNEQSREFSVKKKGDALSVKKPGKGSVVYWAGTDTWRDYTLSRSSKGLGNLCDYLNELEN